MELTITSFIDWYSAIEDDENPVLHIFAINFTDLPNSILIIFNVRLGLKK